MPAPLAIYSTWKALWNESKPLRNWLWGKMPIVKDVRKREIIEGHLAKLLDDSNKLAQAMPSSALEEKLTERIDLFRKEIAKEGVTGEQADQLVERANLLTRLYVTGPLGNVMDLRFRLAEDEEALRQAEKSIEALLKHTDTLETQFAQAQASIQRMTLLVAGTATAALLGLIIALAALVAHR